MHPELHRRFDDLEVRRKALVDSVRNMPAAAQSKKAEGNGFSPLETVMHLAIAETGNNKFLRNAPPSRLAGRKVWHGFAYGGTLRGMQNPTKPLTAPPMYVPKGKFTLDEADAAWEAARKDLSEYLDQVERPDDAFIKFLFFFGTLSANDYLDFTEAHMTYHETRMSKG